jgi:very-short-patch-repair endonuclease
MNTQQSRDLRRNQTDPELKLWTVLRGRPGGFKFRRQHPIGTRIADFACPEARLIIELDGGGHAEPGKVRSDRLRQVWLERQEWQVLRFWNFEVWLEFEGVMEAIWAVLPCSPSPRPSPR